MCCFLIIFPTVPSAAPTSVSASSASTSITVQWGAVNCIHRNGDITRYSVRYRVQGNGSTLTVSVLGGEATMTTISGLMPSTTYSIEVAAVNSAGTGVDSDPYIIVTDSKHYNNYILSTDAYSVCIIDIFDPLKVDYLQVLVY